MVNLNLSQMAADYEGRQNFHEEQKKLDYKKVESAEHEMEKWVFERKRMQKREKIQEKKKRRRMVEPNSFDEMIDAVDALTSSLISPTEAMEPQTPSYAAEQFPPPPTKTMIEIAELDACETAIITTPSPSPSLPAETDHNNKNRTKPSKPSESITAHPSPLHSNPPTTSERLFARNLGSAHHARMITADEMANQKKALAAFDAVTQYGKGVKKRTKMSFGEAVQKGFRDVFGGERCW